MESDGKNVGFEFIKKEKLRKMHRYTFEESAEQWGLGQRFAGDCNFYCCGLVIFRRGEVGERQRQTDIQLSSSLATMLFIRLGFLAGLMDSIIH